MTIEGYNPDELPQTFSYNTDGTLAYIQVTLPSGNVWRQNFTYTSGSLSGLGAWVKQ